MFCSFKKFLNEHLYACSWMTTPTLSALPATQVNTLSLSFPS